MTPESTVSERKLTANRLNAQRSTGPRTPEGKARVSLNSLRHGLRAKQVVLPGEDEAAFAADLAEWFEEWRPADKARAILVERLAVGAWRLRRCVRVETARLTEVVEDAGADHDEETDKDIDDNVALLLEDPPAGLDALTRSRPGIGFLLQVWDELAESLVNPGGWNSPADHHLRLMTALGIDQRSSPLDAGPVAVTSWTLLVTNNPGEVGSTPWADPHGQLGPIADPRSAEMGRQFLLKVVRGSIEELRRLREGLPDPDAGRARRIDAALCDPPSDVRLSRRYESTIEREFRSNLGSLLKLGRTEAGPLVTRNEPSPDRPSLAGEPETERSGTVTLAPAPPGRLDAPSKPTEPVAGGSATRNEPNFQVRFQPGPAPSGDPEARPSPTGDPLEGDPSPSDR